MYGKLIIGSGRNHLVERTGPLPDLTLCGCTITQPQNWKIIHALEGDECPRCADRAFLEAECVIPA
jgi:hypothetical protein